MREPELTERLIMTERLSAALCHALTVVMDSLGAENRRRIRERRLDIVAGVDEMSEEAGDLAALIGELLESVSTPRPGEV